MEYANATKILPAELIAEIKRYFPDGMLFIPKEELDRNELKPYIRNIIDKIEKPTEKNPQDLAEDLLMYSTQIQNYVSSKEKN